MKKLFTIVVLVIVTSSATGQPHLSTLFNIDTIITLTQYTKADKSRELVGTIYDDEIFFCRNKIENQGDIDLVKIFKVNLLTGKEETTELTIPQFKSKTKIETNTNALWINGIAVSEKYYALFEQEKVVLYKRENSTLRIDTTLSISNIVQGYFHNAKLYLLELENHEKYVLHQISIPSFEDNTIRDFQFEAPFLLQFTPNRYIGINENGIYHLNTNHIGYTKYNLAGEKCYHTQAAQVPWKEIPQDVTDKIMEKNYGIERIFQALSINNMNSYCTKILPFDDRCLIVYHEYDSTQEVETYKVLFTKYDSEAQQLYCTSYRFDLSDKEELSKEIFPFYLYKKEILLTLTSQNRIIQIIQDAPIKFEDINGAEYKQKRNKYFETHDPIIRLRILSLKPSAENTDSLQTEMEKILQKWDLKDFYGNKTISKNISKHSSVLIVNGKFQCTGCQNLLYQAMGEMCKHFNKDTNKFCYIFFPETDDILIKKEVIRNAQQKFGQEFIPIFISDKTIDFKNDSANQHTKFPQIILTDNNTTTIFSAEDIFTENTETISLKSTFVQAIQLFLQK
ncbi:MAG: hypothetical protein MJZ76_01660 [Bacteroidales bacterium]|nr:hypothetical protein [Bacteroidales bacterium]